MTHESRPKELFHYTSSTGVLGILQGGSVWASMVHYLNDGAELKYALGLARELVVEGVDGDGEAPQAVIADEFLRRPQNLAVFAFSLSGEKDSLSQWRAYCPPEGGYAVGFSSDQLARKVDLAGFALVECEYDRDKQRALLRPVVTELTEAARQAGFAGEVEDIAPEIRDSFALVGAALKDPSFRDEAEWRVVVTPNSWDTVQYRAQRSLVVPYLAIDIGTGDASPVTRVVVGPHRHKDLAARSLRFLTSIQHRWPIRVDYASTPFRVLS